MAGLSDKERIGCAKLLSLMSESDLRSLCETVTSKKIEVETSRGNITLHCQSIYYCFKVQSHHRDGLGALLGKDINTLIKPSKWSHNISG